LGSVIVARVYVLGRYSPSEFLVGLLLSYMAYPRGCSRAKLWAKLVERVSRFRSVSGCERQIKLCVESTHVFVLIMCLY